METLREAARRLEQGETTSAALVDAALSAIEEREAELHSFLTLLPEVRAAAETADASRPAEAGALYGIPYAAKDNLVTEGVRTTAASRILEGYLPPYSATAIERLEARGALLLGKTNLDEFAMGSSTEYSAYGPSRNPVDPSRVPGGSSGGSAVAVAAGFCHYALGSETGGSVRQPAAFCGCVGLKPSYGRVSRYGLIAFASSLDQIGTLTRDVRDAGVVLGAIAGRDPRDQTSVDAPVADYLAEIERGARGLRFGVPAEYLAQGVAPAVRDEVLRAADLLEAQGLTRRDVSLPHTPYALDAYYIIAPAEASSNLARFDGMRYGPRDEAQDLLEAYRRSRGQGFGPEVKRRILLGTYVLSAGYYDTYYLRAQKLRTLLRAEFSAAFDEVDVLLTPTTPTTAFPFGANTDDPLAMYMADALTIPANLAGLCAISVPGRPAGGLPVGLQLMASPMREDILLRAAAALEEAVR
ncbi:MAG: Asp-tRNA(Asn)/Glu-tRNA(Gln) amidotransferase subunit GatA [Thermaerobacter sp.]|nr:Asp-tRNA(Asn)/Glu-tRNA(Gln) amidotransferase subunit GatA [Thermaerobacter sp.]